MKFAYSNQKFFLVGCVVSLLSGAILFGCTGNPKKPPFDLMPHMADSSAIKAQHIGPMGEGMRTPPAGTVAQNVNEQVYLEKKPEILSSLSNPEVRTKANLMKGQKLYNTYCIVCHGEKGEGNGSIVPKFPMPPTLHSEKVVNWKDSQIFTVITAGQNLMPSYSSQIAPEDRWAIVNYVRVLQRALNPSESDLRAAGK